MDSITDLVPIIGVIGTVGGMSWGLYLAIGTIKTEIAEIKEALKSKADGKKVAKLEEAVKGTEKAAKKAALATEKLAISGAENAALKVLKD
jgi:uncharacterized ParB-like nuclease family protein